MKGKIWRPFLLILAFVLGYGLHIHAIDGVPLP